MTWHEIPIIHCLYNLAVEEPVNVFVQKSIMPTTAGRREAALVYYMAAGDMDPADPGEA